MRLYLKLSHSIETVPFNYQQLLTGCLHKWLGENNLQHGEVSQYSFSWLQNMRTSPKGLLLTPESYFFINLYEKDLAKKVVDGIISSPEMFMGIRVDDLLIKETPVFRERESFIVASPILIKRSIDNSEKHYIFSDNDADSLMTQTLQTKLEQAGLSKENVSVRFDKSYHSPKTKLIDYKGIKNRVNLCPVILEGSPEQIAFAWNVGIGNSTGIGFGALK